MAVKNHYTFEKRQKEQAKKKKKEEKKRRRLEKKQSTGDGPTSILDESE